MFNPGDLVKFKDGSQTYMVSQYDDYSGEYLLTDVFHKTFYACGESLVKVQTRF